MSLGISSSAAHRALEHSHTATQLLSIVWDRSSETSSCTPSATALAAALGCDEPCCTATLVSEYGEASELTATDPPPPPCLPPPSPLAPPPVSPPASPAPV